MLTSRLISPAITRRWLQPVADTSNLRNSVGRPWEIYHAGKHANSSVVDVFLKNGLLGNYASYFGLSPDFDVGFAILAHDAATSSPDLNVYADIISGALSQLGPLAATQMVTQYGGEYFHGPSDVANFTFPDDGPGLVVDKLRINGTDMRKQIARAAGIKLKYLDLRIYPTNVVNGNLRQFVSVVQDMSALADAGTPTCITWTSLGEIGADLPEKFTFEIDPSDRTALTFGFRRAIFSSKDRRDNQAAVLMSNICTILDFFKQLPANFSTQWKFLRRSVLLQDRYILRQSILNKLITHPYLGTLLHFEL